MFRCINREWNILRYLNRRRNCMLSQQNRRSDQITGIRERSHMTSAGWRGGGEGGRGKGAPGVTSLFEPFYLYNKKHRGQGVSNLVWIFPGINKISYADASPYMSDGFLCWMLLGWERRKFYYSHT